MRLELGHGAEAMTRAGTDRDLRAAPGTVRELIGELEARHPDVQRHSQAVAVLAARMAGALTAGKAGTAAVRLAAAVHDVGKLSTPRAILEKAGPLTDSEWALIRLHPCEGERLLRPTLPGRADVLRAVRSHHERWDGGGYPDGLTGTEVTLPARIIAVADAFQAMLEWRPYRPRRSGAQALDELEENSGTQFDPDCVSALRAAFRQ